MKDVLRVVDPPNTTKILSSSPTSNVHSSSLGDDPSRERISAFNRLKYFSRLIVTFSRLIVDLSATTLGFITSKVNKAKTSLPTSPHHRQRRSQLPVSE